MRTVTLFASCLYYPQGGGHFWVYLNWAMGLRANGCRVIWMDAAGDRASETDTRQWALMLRDRLAKFGFHDLGLVHWNGKEISPRVNQGFLTLDDAVAASDLLLNFTYGTSASNVQPFRRKALVDIDPGLTQVWISRGELQAAAHDLYFTIGETVGQPEAKFSDAGLKWLYTPPCVYLPEWPVTPAADDAAFTTVTHWTADEWIVHDQHSYSNAKRDGFEPYVAVPRRTNQPMELAVCLAAKEVEERQLLESNGWRISDPEIVAGSPQAYRQYLQQSRGEFSCVKPSCVKLQNAWISDRSLCYLASGKPVIMEYTGPSRVLTDGKGIWRFRSIDEAVHCIESVNADYARQCQLARQLAEEKFDAVRVTRGVLERGL